MKDATERLQDAIVAQTVKDYVSVTMKLKRHKSDDNTQLAKRVLEECKQFFESEEFKALYPNVNIAELFEKMDKMADRKLAKENE